jgi:hypothetical protein
MKIVKVKQQNPALLISLTDFVDFVLKSGKPKQTVVKSIKNRPPYAPFEDFWLGLREEIVAFHSQGKRDKAAIDRAMDGVSHNPKLVAYPPAIKAYKRFLGRKQIDWFAPEKSVWSAGGMHIRVNPELGLRINGQAYQLKLYFKKDKLCKAKADLILRLMAEALPSTTKGIHVAILDVREGKLFESDGKSTELSPLLEGEAISFATIWRNLPSNPASREGRIVNE